jgi:nucleoid-associated protein YgaU
MSLAKVQILVENTGKKLFISFNPEEYTINKDNNFASQAIPGLSAPQLQFVNGNMRTLEMELFFDTYDAPSLPKQDVRDFTDKVLGLMEIDPDLHAPPVLVVSWASLSFRCVLARANQKYILFDDDGTPVRARMTTTFNEYVDLERESQQISRQTADYTKRYLVVQGDTLSGIAASHYDDPQQWRPIAIANRMDDPRALLAGQSLVIPSLPYTDPETGKVVV